MNTIKKKNKGFSIVEIIIYASLMAGLVGVIAYTINILFIANLTVRATRRVENSSIIATDRMVREIRAASSIDMSNSALHNTNTTIDGTLSLVIPTSSGTRSVRFYRDNEKIMVEENGIEVGPLTFSNVRVTSLQFYLATTSANVSQAVSFWFTLVGPTSTPAVSEKFYGTVVLRGSYN